MGRDDSLLNTGASSASFGSVKEQQLRTDRREKSVETRAALLPAGEIVKAELQREIDKARNIDYLQVDQMLTDENFRAELMARKKYLQCLIALQGRFSTLLRDNKSLRKEEQHGQEDI